MSEENNKKSIVLIGVLSVILIGLLVTGYIMDKNTQKANNEEYNKWCQSKGKATMTIASENPSKNDSSSGETDKAKADSEIQEDIYTKVKSKKDIKVAVLGDGLALSVGRKTEAGIWQEGFKSTIESKLGSKVNMVSLAQNKTTAKDGVSVVEKNDLSSCDMTVICYGHNDNMSKVAIKDFENNYNKIVSKLKEANSKMAIILILPSTLEKNSEYRNVIVKIANNNQVMTSDMKSAFASYGASEKNLTSDSLPTDLGYQLYTKTLYDTFAAGIK